MSDGKLAVLFFEVGMVLTLISMVLGPFEITGWALATAAVACVVAFSGMFLAFESWKEPLEEERPREMKQPENQQRE
ncbi:hypothetical protein FL966_06205 [Caproiciproducens galactitolivorans]|uniref:Uncharacterized protein n=1 Tax=Caproiciproducens galactitolivorans TaxID=642589 RepID=A0A4Z0YA54_9FIRM|nr:hypothetical protein [Caproiciproducens galactitolivorans]QEY34679.1 hypothetical protein FL966_06205 [Caproiciproducens galactitolivorans]TGJ75850.1 hypothetical protein CAGA_20570 [Caproiciproducens galactitolivorans]